VYTNNDLHILIDEARAGGELEHGRLLGAVHEVLLRCVTSDETKMARAIATHNTVSDSVNSALIGVTDNLLNKYVKGKGCAPVTYIVNGWGLLVLADSTLSRRRNVRRETHMNAYRESLEEHQDPFHDSHLGEQVSYNTARMREAVKTLPLKQQDVLEGYCNGDRLKVTAEEMGITVQRVQQIRAKALGVLREILEHKLD